jgi:hypothetical protein
LRLTVNLNCEGLVRKVRRRGFPGNWLSVRFGTTGSAISQLQSDRNRIRYQPDPLGGVTDAFINQYHDWVVEEALVTVRAVGQESRIAVRITLTIFTSTRVVTRDEENVASLGLGGLSLIVSHPADQFENRGPPCPLSLADQATDWNIDELKIRAPSVDRPDPGLGR